MLEFWSTWSHAGNPNCCAETPATVMPCTEASISQLFFPSAGPLPFCTLFHEDPRARDGRRSTSITHPQLNTQNYLDPTLWPVMSLCVSHNPLPKEVCLTNVTNTLPGSVTSATELRPWDFIVQIHFLSVLLLSLSRCGEVTQMHSPATCSCLTQAFSVVGDSSLLSCDPKQPHTFPVGKISGHSIKKSN